MTPSVLWKRSFLLNLNYLFDEGLKAAQEWEFHTRVLTHKPNYIILDKSLDLVRKHFSTITYNENENKRSWHYFLARLKIYNNQELVLDKDSEKYLSSYLLNSFKKMIVTNNPFVLEAYRNYLLPSGRITPGTKFYGLLAIISFKLLNKGNFFLQKIKYK